ncbi:hypothetical protein BDV12DRAFT_171496 [Aspergillus spectabilis]
MASVSKGFQSKLLQSDLNSGCFTLPEKQEGVEEEERICEQLICDFLTHVCYHIDADLRRHYPVNQLPIEYWFTVPAVGQRCVAFPVVPNTIVFNLTLFKGCHRVLQLHNRFGEKLRAQDDQYWYG